MAVDVQVRTVAEYLGVTEMSGLDLEDVRETIVHSWARDVAEQAPPDPTAWRIRQGPDPALWSYAVWGCTFLLVS